MDFHYGDNITFRDGKCKSFRRKIQEGFSVLRDKMLNQHHIKSTSRQNGKKGISLP